MDSDNISTPPPPLIGQLWLDRSFDLPEPVLKSWNGSEWIALTEAEAKLLTKLLLSYWQSQSESLWQDYAAALSTELKALGIDPMHHSDAQPRSILGTFQAEGEPKGKPVCVALPLWADELVRAKPQRSQWLAQAIIEKLQREMDTKNE